MELTLHREFAPDMKGEWNALLERSISDVPFLRFEYLEKWWQTLGGGEWSGVELALVTARDGKRLAGIAPLFLAPAGGGNGTLHLVGAIEVSDYLDLIAAPPDLPVFIAALLDFLSAPEMAPWQAMELYNLPEASPTIPLLEKAARERGWGYSMEVYRPTPYIALPGDWETYLAGIDGKQRHEIRRKLRRLEETRLGVRWYTVRDGDTLDAEMDDFLCLMEQGLEKSEFLTGPMRLHMHNTARFAFDAGMLRLSFLEIGGSKAAAKFSFDYRNRLWGYNSGVDSSFYEYSPGWVLLANELRWAIENGRSELDFMRGGEGYKYRFGAVDRRVMRVTLRR